MFLEDKVRYMAQIQSLANPNQVCYQSIRYCSAKYDGLDQILRHYTICPCIFPFKNTPHR